jgi:hypothetical protein
LRKFANRQSRASKLVYSDNGSGVGSVDESLVLENVRIFNVLEHEIDVVRPEVLWSKHDKRAYVAMKS